LTNKELMRQYNLGNDSVLDELYDKNIGFVADIAKEVARLYNCYHFREDNPNKLTKYSKDMLADLTGQGVLAFLETLRKKEYDESKGMLTTYLYPYTKGAMLRFMELSVGTISVSKDDMAMIRKVQQLYHKSNLDTDYVIKQLAKELNQPIENILNYIGYNTHFLSVYDIVGDDFDSDPFEVLLDNKMAAPTHHVVYRKICIELLKELFDTLTRKEKTIIGKSFGVFGYPNESLDKIALEQLLKRDAIIKARNRALKKLRGSYEGSKLKIWRNVYRTVMREAEKGN
jgi:DNA-directed RNA polymerase sigma subunit (sigma70/sigma32)